MKALKKYLHDGLDLKGFQIIAIWHQSKRQTLHRCEVVILMKSRRPEDSHPWCIQYCGNGHYFQTADEAFEYCESRNFKTEIRT